MLPIHQSPVDRRRRPDSDRSGGQCNRIAAPLGLEAGRWETSSGMSFGDACVSVRRGAPRGSTHRRIPTSYREASIGAALRRRYPAALTPGRVRMTRPPLMSLLRPRLLLLALCVAAAAVLLATASGSAPAGAAHARPNIVLLMTDDQTVSDMESCPRRASCSAATGRPSANSFVSYPLCCPSRATFLTGQYAHNHGVLGNIPPRGGYERARAQGQHAPGLAAEGRLLHDPHRQVPQRLRPRRARRHPARLERLARRHRSQHLPDVGLHAQRERRRQDATARARARTLPPTRPTSCATRRSRRSARRAEQEAVLPVARVPRAARRGTGRESGTAGPTPPGAARPRHVREGEGARGSRVQRGRRAATSRRSSPRRSPRVAARASENATAAAGVAARGRRRGRGDRRPAADSGELDNTLIIFTSDNGFFTRRAPVP